MTQPSPNRRFLRHHAVRPTLLRRTLLGIGMGALVLGACSDDDDGVSIDDPWARPTAPSANNAAFYGILANDADDDDRLVGAASDRCGVTEIHQTTMEDGVMSMSEASADLLAVPSGETLTLEPGGLHVMCMQVTSPLVEGETVELTLTFEQAGELVVEMPVEQR